jgi:hypothetical protein
MLLTAKKIINKKPNFVGRNLTVFPSDSYIVSYPKSGNTWTRFLIGNLIADEEITFSNIEYFIPDIYQNLDRQLIKIQKPRILKSHEYFDPRYKKVILITRDPRDVLVSAYFHKLKYTSNHQSISIDDFAENFIFDNNYHPVGVENRLGTWGGNVGSWLGAMWGNPDFLLIRYEDLKKDTISQLQEISNFLGLDATLETLNRAVQLSTAEQMRKLEQKETNVWPAKQSVRKDIPFVRLAKSGGWKEMLSEKYIHTIEQRWGTTMRKLRYLD